MDEGLVQRATLSLKSGMSRLANVFKILFFAALVMAPSGCATSRKTYDDDTPTLEPSPSKDDSSHGWGTTIGGPN